MGTKAVYDRPELTYRLPDVREFWVEALAGRFDSAAQIYTLQADWERRSHMLELATDLGGTAPVLDRWTEQWSGHSLPLTVKGLHAVGWAWRARTADKSEQVPAEQSSEFRRRLRLAENILIDAAKADPSNPIPWTGLLTTARGLQISRQEAEYRMAELAKRYPLYTGFNAYLQFVSRKWLGSHEEMWEFADSVNTAAPSGSPLHAIQAEASIERFVSQADLLRPKRALEAEGRLKPLLKAADRSVLDPSFDPDCPAGIKALSSFVVAFERYGCRRLNQHLVPMLREHWMAEYPLAKYSGASSHAMMWRSLRGRYRVTGAISGARRRFRSGRAELLTP